MVTLFGVKEQSDGLLYVSPLPPQHMAYRIRAILHEIGVWLGLCSDKPAQTREDERLHRAITGLFPESHLQHRGFANMAEDDRIEEIMIRMFPSFGKKS